MSCTLKPEEIKRVKGMGFLNNKGTDLFNARILTRNGKINAKQMQTIAEAAEKFGNGDVVFTTRLTVEVRAVPFDQIEAFQAYIEKDGLETGGTGALVRPVVSCKGTTCQYGLYDTFALSEKIHELFYKGYRSVKLPHKFKIATGGCPNNCVKPNLNDVGIVGQIIPTFHEELCKGCKKCKIEEACPIAAAKKDGDVLNINRDICQQCGRCIGKCPFHAIEEGTPGFRVYIGGRWGKKVAIGRELSQMITSEEKLLEVVEGAILLFREQGHPGERFAETIERIGFENVEKQLLSGELLKRKEEIIQGNYPV